MKYIKHDHDGICGKIVSSKYDEGEDYYLIDWSDGEYLNVWFPEEVLVEISQEEYLTSLVLES